MSDPEDHIAALRSYYGQQFANYVGLAAEYGLTALRTATVLSGGSLVAFPTVVVAFDLAITPSDLLIPAGLFIGSLSLAALAMFWSYLNFNALAAQAWSDLNREEIEVSEKFDTMTFHRLKDYRKRSKESWLQEAQKAEKTTEWTFWAGVLTGVGAYVLFVVGVVVSALSLIAASDAEELGHTVAQTHEACAYDEAALMALDYQAFDQDLTPGGWRPIADIPECKPVAADLIARWRDAHGSEVAADDLGTLYFHEAQVRAQIGDYAAAIPLFARSYKSEDDAADVPAEDLQAWRSAFDSWNIFVDAHIAFMERDRPKLERARERLAAVPEPPGFTEALKQAMPASFPADQLVWPLNLDDVDAMLRCFDATYGSLCPEEGVQ
jgi:hypothetical protein